MPSNGGGMEITMGDFYKKHKTIVIILIAVVVCIAALIVYMAVHNSKNTDPSDSESTDVQDTVKDPEDTSDTDNSESNDIPSETTEKAPDTSINTPTSDDTTANIAPNGNGSNNGNNNNNNNNDSNSSDTLPTTPETSIGDPSHDHSYEAWKSITPTCVAKGYTIYQCSCGATEIRDYKDPIAHNYGEWTVKKQATESSDGEKCRTCLSCGKTETEIIPKKGNNSGILEITGTDQYGDYKRIEITKEVNGIEKHYVIRDYRPEGSELSYEMQSDGLMIYYTSLDGSIKKDFLLQFPADKNDYRLATFTILSDGTSRYKYFYSDES